nr:hypothetical protein [uncultured Blautia sp.]
MVQKMSQERKVPKIPIIRTVKSIVSAVWQKFVENMELFAHKIRTFKGEPQMKFYKIQDTLSKCSSFLDVACIALDNEHFFPEGNTVSLLLEDVNNRINSCIEELNKMKGNAKNE